MLFTALRGALYAVPFWYALKGRKWACIMLIVLDLWTVLIAAPLLTVLMIGQGGHVIRNLLIVVVPVFVFYVGSSVLAWKAFYPARHEEASVGP
jgi:hypothetical protein